MGGTEFAENSINIWHWDRLLAQDFDFILVVRHPFDIVASMDEIQMNRAIPTILEERAAHVRTYIEAGLEYCEAYPSRASIRAIRSARIEPERRCGRDAR